MVALQLEPEFGWVVIGAAVICFHYMMQGFVPIGKLRQELFSKQFFEENFPGIKPPPNEGYPDMGNGRYSQKWTLDQWIRFNNAQRAHYNYLEGLTMFLVWLLACGLFYPRLAFLMSVDYVVGRHLYCSGYRGAGPKGRLVGGIILHVAELVCLGGGVYGAYKFAGGCDGLMKMF